jgi:hypothetical protein
MSSKTFFEICEEFFDKKHPYVYAEETETNKESPRFKKCDELFELIKNIIGEEIKEIKENKRVNTKTLSVCNKFVFYVIRALLYIDSLFESKNSANTLKYQVY